MTEWGKFMGRMGEIHGKNERECCDIKGRLLGRISEVIGKKESKCCDI